MPSTVNGCGTHYYGKRNLQKRPGPCPHCGSAVELQSYDTRVFVVVVYIPIIPLKRMHIVDYCPTCTRHYAVEADKWEQSRQTEVSAAMEKFRADPTAEAAMALHQQLLNFHQLDKAAELRQAMRTKFADNAKVHIYLGAALEHFGKVEESDGCYARALALSPDLPEARAGVACSLIRAGRLDEAHKLLDFLEKPGASEHHSLLPLDLLARGYQAANRHDDALAIFAFLQKELPKLSEEKWFRSLVAKSEKTSGRKESQLPSVPFSVKRLFAPGQASATRTLLILGVLALLVAVGFAVANEYIRQHRTLHIVNGFSQPADVKIEGVGEFKRIRSAEAVPLAEGRYHATISGPVQHEVDFEVSADYWSRWLNDPAWVLNIGGEAVLLQRAVTYRKDPPPATVTVHYGKEFQRFEGITHPFTELPESLRMKSHEERTLVDLQLFQGDASEIFNYLNEKRQPVNAMEFAEHRLRAHPEDDYLLRLYLAAATGQGQSNRASLFLHDGLAVRPVRIEWHRAYQSLHENPAELPVLLAEYDVWLQAAPTNSALLYLRGRIESNRAKARDYFERARQADAQNPFPIYALGYDRMAAGDWSAARPLFAQAHELRPQDRSFEHWLNLTRFALGENADIEKEAREKLAANPPDIFSALRLVDALAAQGKREEALQCCQQFDEACNAKYGAEGSAMANALRCHVLYALGDFAELEKRAVSPVMRCQAMLEQGRLSEALKAMPAKSKDDEEYQSNWALALAVACREAGQPAEAAQWLRTAHDVLAQGNDDSVQAAALLHRATAPTLVEAQQLTIEPQLKAVLLAAIVQQHPEARASLSPLARSLNVERTFPYHLVQRVTDTGIGGQIQPDGHTAK